MQKKSEPRSTGRGSNPPRKKITTAKKNKESGKEKDTIFLGACTIESAHLTATKLGREIEDLGFKTTYARLKKLYKELD